MSLPEPFQAFLVVSNLLLLTAIFFQFRQQKRDNDQILNVEIPGLRHSYKELDNVVQKNQENVKSDIIQLSLSLATLKESKTRSNDLESITQALESSKRGKENQRKIFDAKGEEMQRQIEKQILDVLAMVRSGEIFSPDIFQEAAETINDNLEELEGVASSNSLGEVLRDIRSERVEKS